MAYQEKIRVRRTIPWQEVIFVGVLLLYPLRHIHWGLDLWDTGYNYANFEYMGLEHMDSMWLFSTYLATAVGHLLTLLPFGDCLMGMNFYTGLFVSALSLLGYFFCVEKLKMPRGIAFAGEFAAISLCWSPTALLYNYLTYLLFLGCVILLYQGLTQDKCRFLFAAGVCLGANVLVRFSNLPQAAMILAVWAYAAVSVYGGAEESKEEASGHVLHTRERAKKGRLGQTFCLAGRYTLWCLGGYLTALLVLLGCLHIRYGLGNYIEGIQRLFAMTDNATDYKASSMVVSMLSQYWENLYWVVRIAAVAAAGLFCFGIVEFLGAGWPEGNKDAQKDSIRYEKSQRTGKRIRILLGMLFRIALVLVAAGLFWYISSAMYRGYDPSRYPGISLAVRVILWVTRLGILTAAGLLGVLVLWDYALRVSGSRAAQGENNGNNKNNNRYLICRKATAVSFQVVWGLVMILMFLWMLCRISSTMYYSYDPILRPGILFLMLAMGIGVIRIVQRRTPKEEKLISGMVILVILLTSLGSNNKLYPSLNNLFVAAPYTLWQCWKFCRLPGRMLPVKAVAVTFLSLFLVQSGMFGVCFMFAEATGVQDVSAMVEDNAVLRGIRMNPRRAESLQGLSDYVKEKGLSGREVILYGGVPSLSYYLQMPSAFNPWSDLDSYSYETFAAELRETARNLEEERPVVLAENKYALYWEGGTQGLGSAGMGQQEIEEIQKDEKWQLIADFLEKYGYRQTFRNEKFAVWE